MAKRKASHDVLRRWRAIPDRLRRLVRGVPARRLDARAGTQQMTIRETVHHLVEANLVASNIVISALARPGSTYDWSWVFPNAAWIRRMGYARAPLAPALATLSGLTRHIAAVVSVARGGLHGTVKLFDTPGARRYSKTVAQVLGDEVSHAAEHLGALPRRPRRARRRRGTAPGASRAGGARGRELRR